MKRREFLETAGGVSLASALADFVGAAEPAPLDMGSLFEANRPEVLALAKRVMEKCVLDKIMPPTPPLKNTWIVRGGPYYKGQWIGDMMFVVDLLSILPGKEKLIRDVFQIASGLAAYGHKDLAANIGDKTVGNAIKNGISEHYDSISGRPLGVRDYCMSSTLVTMMLDGLTRRYELKLRDGRPPAIPAANRSS